MDDTALWTLERLKGRFSDGMKFLRKRLAV